MPNDTSLPLEYSNIVFEIKGFFTSKDFTYIVKVPVSIHKNSTPRRELIMKTIREIYPDRKLDFEFLNCENTINNLS